MLNLGTYIPSNENFDDAIPSPLVDGDVPVTTAPVVEPVDTAPLPVEEFTVELPAVLDPTPLQPLEGSIIQEEVIAANLDAEAGQLMGAQVALEGYSKLLRGAGSNMTRQSAAFMAVGMQRANRILGVTSLGLESENSGSQVMAMQKASVDKEGLGGKLKEVAAKVWEWIKEKYAQLKGLAGKLRALFNKDKEKAIYLLAVSDAVESGNPGKIKALEAPAGLRAAQVLALESEGSKDKPVAPKTISLPASVARYVVSNGKITLTSTTGQDVLKKYMTDAVALTRAINTAVSSMDQSTTVEEATDIVSELIKKHMATGTERTQLLGNVYAVRTPEGVLVIEGEESDDDIGTAELPPLSEVNAYLKTYITGEEPYAKELEEVYNSGSEIMSNKAFADPHVRQLGEAIFRLFRSSGVNDSITKVNEQIAKAHSAAIVACDHIIAAYGGVSNTISQEDYEALPSRALSVVPGQSGGDGIGASIKAGWAKTKEFFAKLWEQFRNWISKLWERIFGTEKKVDMLLLTNEAIPDEGQAPSGEPLALPPGTGLKSVAAAKSLTGPSAPGETPAEVVVEPVVDTGTALPKGFIYTDALKKLKLSSGYAFEPTIEETLISWFTTSYNPAVIKMWRDVTSMANSNFDVAAFDTWGKVLTDMAAKVMAGAPVGEIPGGQSLVLNEGTIAFSFGGGNGTESEPVKALNKRQIAQILARQKRAYRGLELARSATDEQNRLHEQFSQVIERLINSADETKASQYSAFYTTVNQLLSNTAVRQLATTIGSRFDARTTVMDEMIAARAKRG
ncbi:internal head protein [Pseudomonas phage Psa21]|uniref:Putative structural head protein n=1 Tax=Pseudomonas phage Psa21 TaxID=2530023 RepID=A0A481W5H8_9CAUD|nr:internal head protein [Pseudomonas phage Psa21]QBJ02634.1 putative structural head protein [Pseudomonas phage Psa21]